MAVSASKQTSNATRSDTYSRVYVAAIHPQQEDVSPSELEENLSRVTAGGRNTILHLASAAGNIQFIQQIFKLELPSGFVYATNVFGNTALHEAAQSGHYEVVELLLRHRSRVDMYNDRKETPLFKACEGGHSKIVETLLKEDKSKLRDKSSDGRTCLHAVINQGNADLLKELLTYIEKNFGCEERDLREEKDGQGNTLLHLAARRNRLDMVNLLLEYKPGLSYSVNKDEETPVCVAVKLGFLPVVETLVKCRPDSIEIPSKNKKNILHLAVELSQLKTLKFLVEKVDLSQLINKYDAPSTDNAQGQEDRNESPGDTPSTQCQEEGNRSGGDTPSTQCQEEGNRSGGDTPLHIAARNKNSYVVDLLLKVPGVNKGAVNRAHLTPLDIARENTEYHESDKIIQKLSTYPPRRRPFLYKTPATSLQKHKKALEDVDQAFKDRRKVELVVAALLASMTFSAVVDVPGGLHGYEETQKEDCIPGYFHISKNKCVPTCLQRNPNQRDCVEGCLRMDQNKTDCVPGCFQEAVTNEFNEDPIPRCFQVSLTKEDSVRGCFQEYFPSQERNSTKCVPGDFRTNSTEESPVLGMPVLIRYASFKLFLIFDCVAFYLSLFVVLMWEMSTPLTTVDKMRFMCMTSAVLCTAFAFTAYGLMLALYSALYSRKTFSWAVLCSSMFIAFCGTFAFFYMAAQFMVMRARFHSLCGVPRLVDDIVENIWVKAEANGILEAGRTCEDFFRRFILGDIKVSKMRRDTQKKGRSECSGGDKSLSTCSPSADPEHV